MTGDACDFRNIAKEKEEIAVALPKRQILYSMVINYDAQDIAHTKLSDSKLRGRPLANIKGSSEIQISFVLDAVAADMIGVLINVIVPLMSY